jgi:hypothetical protein
MSGITINKEWVIRRVGLEKDFQAWLDTEYYPKLPMCASDADRSALEEEFEANDPGVSFALHNWLNASDMTFYPSQVRDGSHKQARQEVKELRVELYAQWRLEAEAQP